MRNWKIWVLTDAQGNRLAMGRKKDVCMLAYQRYVYAHIFDDRLYRTNQLLKDWQEG